LAGAITIKPEQAP